MTKQEKIDRVIEWLTCGHLYLHGGYEIPSLIHRGGIYVGTTGEKYDEIQYFNLEDMPGWYDEAEAFMDDCDYDKDWPDVCYGDYGDWSEAFWETKPQYEQEQEN